MTIHSGKTHQNNLAQLIEFHTDLTNLTNCASLRPRLSALPPTRMSVGCDDWSFSFTKECSLLLNSAGWRTRVLRCVLCEIREICVRLMTWFYDNRIRNLHRYFWCVCPEQLPCGLSGAPADTPWQENRLQITITVSLRTHKMEKNVYKKKLFSIYTVYYVYCIYIEAYFF